MIEFIEHSNYLEIKGLSGKVESVSVPYASGQFNTEENKTFSIVSRVADFGYYYHSWITA